MSSYQRIVSALQAAGYVVALPEQPPDDIIGVTDDSRKVIPGTLFCAVRGSSADGHAFLDDACRRGAAAVMVAEPSRVALPQIVVNADRAATALAAAEWFGRPGERLDLIGVTGTNGKSTTVLLIRHLLNQQEDVAALGTLGALSGSGAEVSQEGLTTPGAVGLQETLANLERLGTRTAVMEVSSHALDQRRVSGLRFRGVVFTNLTRDHLDYHSSFAEYRAAKLRLVDYVRREGIVVVNADDRAWQGLETGGALVITFGMESSATVRGQQVELGVNGSTVTIDFAGECRKIETPLLGEFNVSNVLAAAAVAWGLGLGVEDIAARLASAPQVPGRMERIYSGAFLVLRDYAHTPDALGRALEAARPLAEHRLVVLFGCGGDRDRGKRSPMGRLAVRGADVVFLTSDNPRTEDPEKILDDIAEGMEGHAYIRVLDRRDAIHRALSMLQPGDCLLLAGKGHETYQVIGKERRPFDEAQIVRDAIGEGESA